MSDDAPTLSVNGVLTSIEVEPRTTLLDFLRERLRLTSVHAGCEHGVCGACTVLLDGEPVRACLMFAVMAQGHQVTTVEGLGDGSGELGVVQDAFWECHGLQCGYCTPAMILTAHALLEREPDPDEATIRETLSGNLCRCTGYLQIVESVQLAADRRRQQR